MMEYIQGQLAESTPLKTVVDVGGVGYRIHIPLSNYSRLPSVGERVRLFISTVIREDSHKLFGFLSAAERDLFETLTEVSGIGPKTALALLGHLEASELQLAISRSDLSSICKVPGIGKKTAERLIVEMRDRFQKNTILPSSLPHAESSFAQDALRALINLGYQPIQAQKAIQAILQEKEPAAPLEDLGKFIALALRKL